MADIFPKLPADTVSGVLNTTPLIQPSTATNDLKTK